MSIDLDSREDMDSKSPRLHQKKSEKKHKSKEHKKRKERHDEQEERRVSKKRRSEHRSDKIRTKKNILDTDLPIESPFHIQTSALYLPLAPISQRTPLEGICAEHLSPHVLTYYPPFHGVILSYSNPRLSEKPFGDDGGRVTAHCIDEYAVSWTWVTADFVVFRPERGVTLEGYVTLQNEGHIVLVCWNLFNALIERDRLPKDWEWVDADSEDPSNETNTDEEQNYTVNGTGYYVNGEGNRIDGAIKFKVRDFESSHDRERGFMSIAGTMLSEEEENDLVARENDPKTSRKSFAGRRLGGSRALGATNLGVPVESSEFGMDHDASFKHRRNY